MFRNIAILVALCFFTACASTPVAKSGPFKPKPFVTPWEYYQKSRPAVMTQEDMAEVQEAAVHSTGSDTKSDKTGVIIIGVVAGVLAIGGTVAGIMLTR